MQQAYDSFLEKYTCDLEGALRSLRDVAEVAKMMEAQLHI